MRVKLTALNVLVVALLFILFAPDNASAKGKTKSRVVSDTTDTLLHPGDDGVTYTEPGPARDAERKVVVEEKTVAVPDKTQGTKASGAKSGARHHKKHAGAKHRAHGSVSESDSLKNSAILADSLPRVPGTPGSPTGQGSRGMPGERPIPGDK